MFPSLFAPASFPFLVAIAAAAGVCLRRSWKGYAPIQGAGPILSLAAFGAGGVAARSFGWRLEPWGPALAAGIAAFVLFGVANRLAPVRRGSAWIGHSAVVGRKPVRHGHIGLARLTEESGQVLVEPLHENERFLPGSRVVLIHAKPGRYLVVADEPGNPA